MKTKITYLELAQFIGTCKWHRHPLNRAVVYTDGIQFLAAKAEAYWLIDFIASFLVSEFLDEAANDDPRIKDMHFWKLQVLENKAAVLEARVDSPYEPFVHQEIGFTDFPLESIRIWAANDNGTWVLYLPSEH